ncbi:hypothetical protein MPC1_11860001 [Methylocella tundrae]|nr:hypothetical protein MPC1_11860001 [Methylocella tundrae]
MCIRESDTTKLDVEGAFRAALAIVETVPEQQLTSQTIAST